MLTCFVFVDSEFLILLFLIVEFYRVIYVRGVATQLFPMKNACHGRVLSETLGGHIRHWFMEGFLAT